MKLKFITANQEHAQPIGTMVFQLIEEIYEQTNAKNPPLELESVIQHCEDLLLTKGYSAILAFFDENPIAVATLAEGNALYAGGRMGTIQEFYVCPEYRSKGIGSNLINEIRRYGRKKNWSRIEVSTPSLPQFNRSLDFYESNNFEPTGCKLKLEFK